MSKFANLFEAGVELGALMNELDSDCVLMPVMPNGVPVALGAESFLGKRDLYGLPLARDDSGAQVDKEFSQNFDHTLITNRVVVLIDDGVETGTAAKACGAWLKELGIGELVLAVPVCPRTAMNRLQFTFDRILTVTSPLGARALAWHYEELDAIDMTSASKLLADRAAH